MIRSLLPFNYLNTIAVMGAYLEEESHPRLFVFMMISPSILGAIAYFHLEAVIDSNTITTLLTVVAILLGFSINTVVLLNAHIKNENFDETVEEYYLKTVYACLHSIGTGVTFLLTILTVMILDHLSIYPFSTGGSSIIIFFLIYYLLTVLLIVRNVTDIVYADAHYTNP